MIPEKADVVIIGGGPAGAMAAACLAKNGIEAIVLEKAVFPRYAVGESLIPHFWKFTDLIGASEAIENAGFIKKSGGSVYWEEQLKILSFGDYGYTRPGLHVERDEFDSILLNRAKTLGANVNEGVTVENVIVHDNKNVIHYIKDGEKASVTSKFLIDASGQSALLAKQFDFRKFDTNFRFQAFWGYFDQSEYLNKEGEITSFNERFATRPTSLVTGTGDWGWTWNLLLKEKVSVGAIIPKHLISDFKAKGDNLNERFMEHIQQTPLAASFLKKSRLVSEVRTIRDYAYLPTKLTFNNCFLIGDAAAFADPINSEGVTMGLYGGMLAAWAIENSLKNETRKDFYEKVFAESLGKRFSVFQLLSYPKERIPPHLMEHCLSLMESQSDVENNLILAHLTLTNRANDFPDLLNALEINIKRKWREIPITGRIADRIKVTI